MEKIFKDKRAVVMAAVFCNLLWGSAYPGIKIGYKLFAIPSDPFSQMVFAGVRFFLAGAVVLCVSTFVLKKSPVIKRTNIFAVIKIAVVYTFFQYLFFYVGLSHTSGANGSIVNSSSTFMAVVAAHFAYKNDKINARKIIGCIVGFAGVLVVAFSGSHVGFNFPGEGFIMIAALCFAIGGIFIKNLSSSEDTFTISAYNMIIGGALLIVVGLIGGGRISTVSLTGVFVMCYLVFLSACAYSLWALLLKYNPVGKISVYNFIIPVAGTILSAVFLGENIMDWRYFAALLLVCAGIIIVNAATVKKNKHI